MGEIAQGPAPGKRATVNGGCEKEKLFSPVMIPLTGDPDPSGQPQIRIHICNAEGIQQVVFTNVCVCVCVCVCICVYVYLCVSVYMCVHVSVYVCV